MSVSFMHHLVNIIERRLLSVTTYASTDGAEIISCLQPTSSGQQIVHKKQQWDYFSLCHCHVSPLPDFLACQDANFLKAVSSNSSM